MRDLKKIKIAVIYGGLSKEYPGSVVSGETVYKSLQKQGYNVVPLDPKAANFLDTLKGIELAFLALHGRYGEDGKIQGLLEYLDIPYTDSGVLASALGMDKLTFKKLLRFANIPTPKFEIYNVGSERKNETKRIISSLGLPLFLKPVSEGGSLGAAVIHTKEQLTRVVEDNIINGYDYFLIEQYLHGRVFTIGLLEKNKKIIPLPILETISKKEFYDYEAKHNQDLHTYICPAKLPEAIYKKVENIALQVYYLLGCQGYSRVDFIFDENNNPYVLEVNTLPGLSLQSNMATMAIAGGMSYDQLIVAMLHSVFTKPHYLP